jgi:ubiquinone/menaquinone biosynthesis C-methylase UbiE
MKIVKENYLDFYKENKIIPTVDLKDSNLNILMKQRHNFYLNLGITIDNFQNKEILELGPGTGYNAYFLLKYAKIKKITLVDANYFSLNKLKKNLAKFNNKKIINKNINIFKIKKKFDYIIVENVLGGLKDPKKIFKRVLNFVKPGGSVILTLTEPMGIFSEKLRYLHSLLLLKNSTKKNKKFSYETKILSKEFKSHLIKLGRNTRNSEKWVQDNMLNKAWITKNKYFSFYDLYKSLNKKKFLIKNSSPNYNTNFDWYKNFNTKIYNFNYLKNYLKNQINLIHIKEKFNSELGGGGMINKIKKNKNFKIYNIIIKTNKLINSFNVNSKNFKINLDKINKYIVLLSKLLNSNINISKGLIEFSNLLNNYKTKDKKKIKYDNYKKLWGHTTCPIIVYKLNNYYAN